MNKREELVAALTNGATLNGYRMTVAPPKPEPKRKALETVTFAELRSREIPPREWAWQGALPIGKTASLYGKGGAGKTMLAMQIAEAVATGSTLWGRDTKQGDVLCLFAEDDIDEIGRRVQNMGAGAERVHVVFRGRKPTEDGEDDGEEPLCLMRFERDGKPVLTELWYELDEAIRRIRPSLLVLDNIALLFGGDENIRQQVTAFVAALNAVAHRYGLACLLLGHPSKQDGSQYAGSTAWSNAVRARLLLEQVSEGEEMYRLKVPKSNYSKTDEDGIQLVKGIDGVFHPADPAQIERRRQLDAGERRDKADRLVLRFLRHQLEAGGTLPNNTLTAGGVHGLIKSVLPDWLGDFTQGELQQAVVRLTNSQQLVPIRRWKGGNRQRAFIPAGVAVPESWVCDLTHDRNPR
jgi:hypothetical protein